MTAFLPAFRWNVVAPLRVNEPDSVRMIIHSFSGQLERQARLADPAHAAQQEQTCPCQRLLQLGELALSADERRQLLRQIVRYGFERAQGREILAKPRVHQLERVLRSREIAQPHRAEIAERYVGQQPITDELRHGPRQQHLPRVCCGHYPCCAVHRDSEDIIVAVLDHSDVHATTDSEKDSGCARWIGKPDLQLQRSR
jgi:hypothetical protein